MGVQVTIYNDDEANSRDVEVLHIAGDRRVPSTVARCKPGDGAGPQSFEMERDDVLIVRRVG